MRRTIKQIFDKQKIFDFSLKFLSFLSNWKLTMLLIPPITKLLARLNLFLNRPKPVKDLKELAETWKALMPSDGQENFRFTGLSGQTAFVEIHLHCPLRGTGKVNACYLFMNYDRSLLESIGGSLTVLESQSNSGKSYCKLAIRRREDSIDDLIPAHLNIENRSINHNIY